MKNATLSLSLLLLCCALVSIDAAGVLIPSGTDADSMEIKSHRVEVDINNGIAVTSITQVFKNNEDRNLEAYYYFPVPRNASVSNFSMWIKGKEIVGEVVEKKRAREIYESIVNRREDPGLLEQVSYKLFQVRVFPVMANSTQRIYISYYQKIDYDAGYGTYTYPLKTEERYKSQTSGEFSLTVNLKSEIPVQLYSPSHTEDVAFARTGKKAYRASVEKSKDTLDRDFVLVYRFVEEPTAIQLLTSRTDPDEDGYFMLLANVGEDVGEDRPQRDIVLVLDISGSMEEDKLTKATKAITAFLETLSDEDRFNIITFNIATSALAPRLLPATESQRVKPFLAKQSARGGTDIYMPLQQALAMLAGSKNGNVVLLSDGRITGGIREHRRFIDLVCQRGQGVRIFSLGFGNEVNTPLLERLSRESGGYSDFLSTFDEVGRKIYQMANKIHYTFVADVAVDIEGVETYHRSPTGDNLYRGMQLVSYGRYKGSGRAKVSIRGTLDKEPWKMSSTVEFPQADSTNPEVERMWALSRAHILLQQIRARGETPQKAQEVIDLGETYSIVTPYTSFLVLESEDEYQQYGIERRNAKRLAAERKVQERRRQNFLQTSAPPPQQNPRQYVRNSQSDNSPTLFNKGGGGASGVVLFFVLGLLTLMAFLTKTKADA